MERIYFQATPGQCDWAFRQLIAQNPRTAVIPGTGGLMPELSMLDQILYPCLIAGRKRHEILAELQDISPVPIHRLHDLPVRSREPIRDWAVLLRTLIIRPETIVVNGFFDDRPGLLPRFLELLPEDTKLICLGTMEPREPVAWTTIHKGGIP